MHISKPRPISNPDLQGMIFSIIVCSRSEQVFLRISINLSRTRATDPNNSTTTRFPGTMSSNFMAYIYIIKIKKELVRLGLHTEEDKHYSQNKLKTESSCFKPNTEKEGSSWSGKGTHVRIKCMLQKYRRLIINICDSDRKSTRRK